jgi:hypothetical protein
MRFAIWFALLFWGLLAFAACGYEGDDEKPPVTACPCSGDDCSMGVCERYTFWRAL